MKRIFFLMLTLLAFVFLSAFNFNPGPLILSMSLDDYRHFQEHFGPLDRLFIRNGRGFFIADIPLRNQAGEFGLAYEAYLLSPDTASPFSPALSKRSSNGAFHSYLETEAVLQDLADRHPGLARKIEIGRSVEGRRISALCIGSSHMHEERPNIYILGCHHAREWISVEVPLDFASYLLEAYDTDADVRHRLDNTNIIIIPLVNPDGLEYSIRRYRYWRKNRRHNGNGIWGVDLNRNYGYKWGLDSVGSSPHPISPIFRGFSPFSEPETAALRDYMHFHRPSGVITYHNFSQVILYPWGHTLEPAPHNHEMRELAARMSDAMEEVNGRRYDYGSASESFYLANGNTDDWVYGEFGAFCFTIELPPPEQIGHFFTDESEIVPICRENRPGLLTFIDYFINWESGFNSKL